MNSILFWLLAVSVGQANEKATYQIALSVQQEERSGIYVINAEAAAATE
jgi:hypothetical protein